MARISVNTQTSMDNTVNDLNYEIKFESWVKDKSNFFIKQRIAFLSWTKIYFILETYFFKILTNLITSVFFLPRHMLTDLDMPWQNPQMLHWLNLLIESLKMIMWFINCVMFFCKCFKHGPTSNVIWLSSTWLLIFRLEVANKKPLFATKPSSIWIEISC